MKIWLRSITRNLYIIASRGLHALGGKVYLSGFLMNITSLMIIR